MTRKKFDTTLDQIFAAVAEAHGLNTVSEQKGGDLGEVMQLTARALTRMQPEIVARTQPQVTVTTGNVTA